MAGQERRRRVVLFSLPFQGHLNPMLHLATLLQDRGLGVTVLHTVFNGPDPSRHPELDFIPIHETIPGEVTSPDADILAQLLALNAALEEPFRAALASLLQSRDVACAVVDGQCYAALRAAGQLGVPALALRTDSAATFGCLLAYPRLVTAGYVPIKGKSTFPPVSSIPLTKKKNKKKKQKIFTELTATLPQKRGWMSWFRSWSPSACGT